MNASKHFCKWFIYGAAALFIIGFLFGGASHLINNHHASGQTTVIDMTELKRPTLKTDNTSIRERKGFINQIGYPAVRAFQKHQNYQVLPSVVIAQAIIESDWGRSKLYSQADNVFGVKGSYHGHSADYETAEDNGGKHYVYASFRKYPSIEASILDHDYLLRNTFIKRNQLMDYKKSAELIQKNHYATDPNYAYNLIKTIQLYHLYRYDEIGLK